MKNSPAANQTSSYQTGEIGVAEAEDIIKSEFKKQYGEANVIEYGGKLESTYEEAGQLPTSWGTWNDYIIKSGDSLSKICEKLNLPLAYERNNDKQVIPAGFILYPFIIDQTALVYANKSRPNWEKFQIDENKPDYIVPGTRLRIPGSDFSWLRVATDVRSGSFGAEYAFKACIKKYQELGKNDWAKTLEQGYKILQDTTVLIYG